MKHQNLLSEKEQELLYLVHHMHHYPRGQEVVHEIHHCFLFSEKDMKGKKYTINHLLVGGKLYHILNQKPSKTLYDHLNNIIPISLLKDNQKSYWVVK